MNKTHFYIFVIITFAALVWPYTAVSQNSTLTSDEEMQRILLKFEKAQQKEEKLRLLEKANQRLDAAMQQILDRHFEKYKYIPVILLLNGILFTYCWCILGRKIQSILVFLFGFTLSGPFYSSILPMVKFFIPNLNPNLSEQTIFLICELTGGLLAFVAFWIGLMLKNILISPGCVIICFAVSSIGILLFVFYFKKLILDQELSDQINVIELSAVYIIVMLIGYVITTLEQKYKIVEIVLFATSGATITAYLLLWSKGLSNYKILKVLDEEGYDVLKNIKDENQAILIVILAVTGIIVQWTLLSIIRRYKSKSQDRVSDQVQVS